MRRSKVYGPQRSPGSLGGRTGSRRPGPENSARSSEIWARRDRQVGAVLDRYPGSSAQALIHTTLAARTPTTASVSGSLARLELPGEFYAPQVVRLVDRAGGVAESDTPRIRGHEGLCYEAAHFATLVAEGRRESPLLPLDETVSIIETLDALRAQVGVVYPGE